MALVLTSGPATEPITVQEAKTHLRIDGTAEDVLIASLILTARLALEQMLGCAFITQSWSLQLDGWPECGEVEIPLSPLLSITSASVKNSSGVPVVISPQNYIADVSSRPGRLVWNSFAPPLPQVRALGIEILFTAGFGATAESVPRPLRHALLLLIAYWYEHREMAEPGLPATHIPEIVAGLVAPFRTIRL